MTDEELGLNPKKEFNASQAKVYNSGLRDAKESRHSHEPPTHKERSISRSYFDIQTQEDNMK